MYWISEEERKYDLFSSRADKKTKTFEETREMDHFWMEKVKLNGRNGFFMMFTFPSNNETFY